MWLEITVSYSFLYTKCKRLHLLRSAMYTHKCSSCAWHKNVRTKFMASANSCFALQLSVSRVWAQFQSLLTVLELSAFTIRIRKMKQRKIYVQVRLYIDGSNRFTDAKLIKLGKINKTTWHRGSSRKVYVCRTLERGAEVYCNQRTSKRTRK